MSDIIAHNNEMSIALVLVKREFLHYENRKKTLVTLESSNNNIGFIIYKRACHNNIIKINQDMK